MKKRILVLILVVVSMVATGCYSASGSDIVVQDEPNGVATLSIYAFDGTSESIFMMINMGHAFVSVKNISSESIMVGSYELEPNCEVSVGNWGMGEHFGIWYNLESTYMSLGRYQGVTSLSQDITQEELASVSGYLAEHDYWTFSENCSYHATSIWNAASTSAEMIDMSGVITPGRLQDILKENEISQTTRVIENFGTVGYASNGSIIEFELVD